MANRWIGARVGLVCIVIGMAVGGRAVGGRAVGGRAKECVASDGVDNRVSDAGLVERGV